MVLASKPDTETPHLPASFLLDEGDLEWTRCSLDPKYFIFNYVITIDDEGDQLLMPDGSKGYDYLEDYIDALHNNKKIIVIKSRQMLLTWATVAYMVWIINFKKNHTCLAFCKKKTDAYELIDRAYFIISQLPDHIRTNIVHPKSQQKVKNEFNSRIVAMACIPEAARLYTAQFILMDEAAFYKDAKGVFTGAKPCLGKKGKLVVISTPNRKPQGKWYKQQLKEYKRLGYVRCQFHYRQNPRKDKEWEKEERNSLSSVDFRVEHEMSLESAGAGAIWGKEFSRDIQQIDDFPIPSKWKKYRSLDFGPRFACLWFAVESSKPNNIYIYRRIILRGIGTKRRAEIIKQRSEGETFQWTVSDSADPQARRDMMLYGVPSVPCADKDTLDSIEGVRKYFEGDGEEFPTIYIFSSCAGLSDNIEEYMGDENGIPLKHQEDHDIDALRYFIVKYDLIKTSSDFSDDEENFSDDDYATYETDNEFDFDEDIGLFDDSFSERELEIGNMGY